MRIGRKLGHGPDAARRERGRGDTSLKLLASSRRLDHDPGCGVRRIDLGHHRPLQQGRSFVVDLAIVGALGRGHALEWIGLGTSRAGSRPRSRPSRGEGRGVVAIVIKIDLGARHRAEVAVRGRGFRSTLAQRVHDRRRRPLVASQAGEESRHPGSRGFHRGVERVDCGACNCVVMLGRGLRNPSTLQAGAPGAAQQQPQRKNSPDPDHGDSLRPRHADRPILPARPARPPSITIGPGAASSRESRSLTHLGRNSTRIFVTIGAIPGQSRVESSDYAEFARFAPFLSCTGVRHDGLSRRRRSISLAPLARRDG